VGSLRDHVSTLKADVEKLESQLAAEREGADRAIPSIRIACQRPDPSAVLDGEVKKLVPDAAELAVIERMKAMRRDGASLRAIGAVTGHGPKSVQRILERASR
jgi:hypothetical protein